MLKVKRRASGSDESRKVRKRVSRVRSDLGEGMTESLSQELAEKLSPSIISLASFDDGDNIHCICTGIVIEERSYGRTILTSLNLVTTADDKRKVIRPLPKIKVRLPNNQVVTGWFKQLNLRCNMVVVTTTFFPDLRAARLSNNSMLQVDSHATAVKRCFHSGKLMASSGVLVDRRDGVGYEGLTLSTCKITMDGSGGPLVDSEGNIVGMNEYLDTDMTRCIPSNQLLEHLRYVMLYKDGGVPQLRLPRRPQGFSSAMKDTSGDDEVKELDDEPQAPECTGDKRKRRRIVVPDGAVNKSLRSNGYTLPKYGGGIRFKRDFEEEFSVDICRDKTIKRIALKTCQSVVALASFSDKGRRYCACSGVLIGSNQSIRVLTSADLVRNGNKIKKSLRIEVYLPNRAHKAGVLQQCSLKYNVAVVSIIHSGGNRAAKFSLEPQNEVLALGRVFESGNFMATRGVVTGKQSRFGHKKLKVSSCKITKAGIGGPLVDFNGEVVGMNFCDMEETPYLPSNKILKLLRKFGSKGTVAAGIREEEPYDAMGDLVECLL